MLFDLATDPHAQRDLAAERPELASRALGLLAAWYGEMMATSPHDVDPLMTVLRDGGPHHARGAGGVPGAPPRDGARRARRAPRRPASGGTAPGAALMRAPARSCSRMPARKNCTGTGGRSEATLPQSSARAPASF
jgi:hypothetical protein